MLSKLSCLELCRSALRGTTAAPWCKLHAGDLPGSTTTPIAMADKPIEVEVPVKDEEKEESKTPSPPDDQNPEDDEKLVEMVRRTQ